MKKYLGSALLLILTIGLFGYHRFYYYTPSLKKYPLRGVDVSHHQGVIDWETLSQQDLQFAYLKATEGHGWKDRKFKKNWEQTQEIGLKRGAYHFYHFCSEPKAQAQNFIDTVPKESSALPPVVDLEFGGNCSQVPEKATLQKDILTWLEIIENHYQQKPIIYVTQESYDAYIDEALGEYGLWNRSLFFPPTYGQNQWVIWQYHNRGERLGVEGPIDLNVAREDLFK